MAKKESKDLSAYFIVANELLADQQRIAELQIIPEIGTNPSDETLKIAILKVVQAFEGKIRMLHLTSMFEPYRYNLNKIRNLAIKLIDEGKLDLAQDLSLLFVHE